ncbi:MAG: hypothetical protein COW88_00315 [Candidatus Lloydbacteria bacterium CG22_combo_CG10-13_8_21_14_all_47_15]|uniref:phosphoribosylaminoimidazolesuccinocarboxamide synthase n=1 Tax=Candidatus Lloydbacteria bacterium CG22_combo_CG10-13_8_21_14_all_47_15 TaxID=1974635 RepID=A0A2H0CVX8_9BACT|nr:MAG: hypothetical protein COW88_00315 [Candidatus Lloydbacteria bacterium CG22_combo_CG10-13_8_21_14_all_47_15]
MQTPQLIKKGKVKDISVPYIIIANSDMITAGDGKFTDNMPGKAILNTEIAVNCFRLLNKNNISNHFISRESNSSIKACFADAIPIEVVCRRYAFGSYLAEHPECSDGDIFPTLEVEFFMKDDKLHDPRVVPGNDGMFDVFFVKWRPGMRTGGGVLSGDDIFKSRYGYVLSTEMLFQIQQTARLAFEAFEYGFRENGYVLIDMKFEFGLLEHGAVIVIDGITPDEWRLVRHVPGTGIQGLYRDEQKSKQLFRDMKKARKNGVLTANDWKKLYTVYQECAEVTARF